VQCNTTDYYDNDGPSDFPASQIDLAGFFRGVVQLHLHAQRNLK
jgi:hypothetical protein